MSARRRRTERYGSLRSSTTQRRYFSRFTQPLRITDRGEASRRLSMRINPLANHRSDERVQSFDLLLRNGDENG
jgi:hypothetical protein